MRVAILAVLAVLAVCTTARAAQAELKESGGFAQVGLVVGSTGGLLFQGAPNISIGYRSGQSVYLVGLSVAARKDDLFSTSIGGDGTAGTFVVGSEHIFAGSISPAYRRYFSAPRPDALVPFAQIGLDLGLERISFTPGNTGAGTTWFAGGRVAIGGEYLIGGHFGVELRAELQGSHSGGSPFAGAPDQDGFVVSLGGAGAINLHW